MPLLLLVRHGETAWNAEQRWQGHHGEPLSPAGRAQAEALAARVAARTARRALLLRSPARARDREEIARRTGLEPTLDARWREVDVGEWLGLTPDEVRRRSTRTAIARWLAGGTGWREGETYPEMAERGARSCARSRRAPMPARRAPVVCVTHGGVIRAIVMHVARHAAVGTPAARDGPDGDDHRDRRQLPVWRLRSFNDAGHLPR